MNQNNIEYNDDPTANEHLLKVKKMDLDSGWLGKFFGGPTHSPMNIAGLLIVLLVFTGIIMSLFIKSSDEYWTNIIPVVTLALGYLFGKH